MQIGGASCVASYVAGIGKRGRKKVATTLAARNLDVSGGATPKGGATVVISGGSQGVGRATALKFAQAGFNVVLAARNEEALREAEKLCLHAVQPGRAVLAVSCDITSPESIEELQQCVASQFTDLRVVVCNAGVCMTGDFLSHSLDDFASQMNVNFLGHVSTVRAFLPQLLARVGRSGVTPTVCFVNSFGGRLPLPDMTAYCASKYALQGFSDSLRLELSQKGVHVSTVHPGVIRSDFRQRAQWRGEGNQRQRMMDNLLDGKTPLSGTITQSVDEIAGAVFDAVQRKQTEVVVGLPFQAALGAFGISKVLGIN